MNNKKNFISSIILQLATIINGLILPRLIITSFGSSVNGMVSSITQFLSFISLLEGGLGAVVLAELYKPIEDHNTEKVRVILASCQSFFNKLSAIFILYTAILSVIYPVFIANKFDFGYSASLVWILSLTTLAQYLFSITNKLLLQADQKIYIVNLVMAITVVLNLLLAIIVIKIFPEIHLVKAVSAIVYFIQPVIYNKFVDKKYNFRHLKTKRKYVLKNRWSGFAQNLAYFINMNTDIAVVTIFLGLTEVSIYSVYMLAINALRSFITSAANSYQSALGKYYAIGDVKVLKNNFERFELGFWIISCVLFNTCLLLINQFVGIYTSGVKDANYYQPIFALIIILANLIYCLREPYRLLTLAAGKFKETNFGSFMEAGLNLAISILLVMKFGLTGIAIGTLIGIIYRLFYFIRFLRHDILYLNYNRYIKLIVPFCFVVFCNLYIYEKYPIKINNFIYFCIYGLMCVVIELLVTFFAFKISDFVFRKLESKG